MINFLVSFFQIYVVRYFAAQHLDHPFNPDEFLGCTIISNSFTTRSRVFMLSLGCWPPSTSAGLTPSCAAAPAGWGRANGACMAGQPGGQTRLERGQSSGQAWYPTWWRDRRGEETEAGKGFLSIHIRNFIFWQGQKINCKFTLVLVTGQVVTSSGPHVQSS